MITKDGSTNQPGIMPEGIVITFAKSMMKDQGGMKHFLQNFAEVMDPDNDDYWMHKCSNGPKIDVPHVYIVVANRLYGRVNYAGMEKSPTTGYTAHGIEKEITWNRLILAGPFEKCPFKRKITGFQGFRYCTKLF